MTGYHKLIREIAGVISLFLMYMHKVRRQVTIQKYSFYEELEQFSIIFLKTV